MFRHNTTNLISLPMICDQSVNEYGMNVLNRRMYGGIPATQQYVLSFTERAVM